MKALTDQINRMADEGLRVIGVAKAHFSHTNLPDEQHDFKFEFIGLLGLSDPVRPEVADAVQECYTAGVRIIMITGDYPGTARNIARQIGLDYKGHIITGLELDQMNDTELQERIKTTSIFARAVPEQKLRIVTALKANGEVVAMTGDGVNDAPALKAAHIGIAMGGRGTDVARESAALVLLDDNFASIVQAVRMGRRIFDNLKKAMAFIFAVHIPIAGLSLIPVLLKWPLALLPVHILFLELIIDPACTIVFEMETEEKDVMNRPPRPLNEPLFGRAMILTGLIQGVGLLAVVFGMYALSLGQNLGEATARMMSFSTMVLGNLGLIFTNRSWTHSILATLRIPNKALWWISGFAVGFLALVMAVPFLRQIFQFAPLQGWEAALIAAAVVISLLIAESVKLGPVHRFIVGKQ
jgi:P-type Ca2+ transporter type 2C